jgi:carboxyl-terminal processing protease
MFMKFFIKSLLILSYSLSLQAAPPLSLATTQQEDTFDKIFFDWSRTIAEAAYLLKTKYYEKGLNPQEGLSRAINSFVCNDPHSSFLDPKTYKSVLESTGGEFFGIGIIIANKGADDEFLVVLDTIPEGPADKAGIRQGDKIIEVDDMALRGMTTDETTAKLKGKRHTMVHVKVVREGYPDPLAFNIVRDVIKEKSSLCYYFKDQNVYYLHLNTFSHNAFKQLSDLIKKSQKQKYNGLILDLRNNSGGLLNSAVDIASLFVEPKSLVVVTKDRNDNVIEKYETKTPPMSNNALPIFILMNNYTASAAEILAGCLKVHSEKIAKQAGNKKQDKLLVFLVGTRTFGKGSVQEIIPVSNDCAVKLTTALYFLPNDTTIQGIGIEPDIEIERKFPPPSQMQWANQFYGSERALKNSIKPNKSKKEEKNKSAKEPEKNMKEKRKEMIANDSQIRDTLTCINILTLSPNAWKTRTDAINLLKKIMVTPDKMTMDEVEC